MPRALLKPSTVVRLMWIAVAVLHAWLFGRRLFSGEAAGLLDGLKLVLGLAGTGYASLKVWRIATVFDSSRRRMLGFTLLLLLGHWLVATPESRTAITENIPTIAVTSIAVLPLVPALGMLLAAVGAALAAWALLRAAGMRQLSLAPNYLEPRTALALCESPPSHYRRPPPALV